MLWHLISGLQISWKYPFYHHHHLENSCGPLSIHGGQFLLSPLESLTVCSGHEDNVLFLVLSEELAGLDSC